MALSAARNVALFQILDVPYFAGHYTLSGMGTVTSLHDLSGATASQAKTTITTFVTDNVESDANLLTVLTTDLDRWITLGSTVARMEGGSVGTLSSVTMDYREERALIADRVRIIVPFYKFHEVLIRQQTGGASAVNVALTR